MVSPLLNQIRDQEDTLIKKKRKVTSLDQFSFQWRITWQGRLEGFDTLLLLKYKSDFDQMIDKYLAKIMVNTTQKWKNKQG